jgi:hypothetical protein
VKIEVYANPSRPTSSGVVKAIVDEFVSRLEEGRISGMTSIVQLMSSGLLDPQNAASEARDQFQNVDESQGTAITLKTPRMTPRVFSFTFPDAPTLAAPARPNEKQASPPGPSVAPALPPAEAHKPVTRIKPPRDLIKLEDRLYYVLQPPLETLVQSDALHFPFEPFPYQFQGVAFLYPRYSAVLADEMGLGKTMQAITSIRMLLRSGELRSVLLICPKPLVTNWRRSFRRRRRFR